MDTSANASSYTSCPFESVDRLLYAWLFLYFLLIPLFLFVLYVGYRRHQKQSPLSHSDVFTYNIVIMEILAIASTAIYIMKLKFREVGGYIFGIGANGQMCFHCLACVDRYLAVAHPITYLRLKERGGVKIRIVAIAGSWAISVGIGILEMLNKENSGKIAEISLSFFFCVVVAFCSFSVLCVLIRPGPGEGGGDSRRMDQSKQRAFIKIAIIMVVLLMRFVFFSAGYLIRVFDELNYYGFCVFSVAGSLLNFPSSLVLPLMFLQKYRKLPKRSIMNCKLQFRSKN